MERGRCVGQRGLRESGQLVKRGEGYRKGKASLVTSTLHTPATAGLRLEFSMEHVAQSSIYARYLYCAPGVFHGFCLLCSSAQLIPC